MDGWTKENAMIQHTQKCRTFNVEMKHDKNFILSSTDTYILLALLSVPISSPSSSTVVPMYAVRLASLLYSPRIRPHLGQPSLRREIRSRRGAH